MCTRTERIPPCTSACVHILRMPPCAYHRLHATVCLPSLLNKTGWHAMVCQLVCSAHEGPACDVPYNNDEDDKDDYVFDGDGNNGVAHHAILCARCSREIVRLFSPPIQSDDNTANRMASRGTHSSTNTHHAGLLQAAMRGSPPPLHSPGRSAHPGVGA